ncbi:hypothetical protein ACLB2K_035790 [Fragaria x ananassa]
MDLCSLWLPGLVPSHGQHWALAGHAYRDSYPVGLDEKKYVPAHRFFTLTGSHAPPCRLLELPTELLAKILKCLPVEDVASVSCVCKELRNLANDAFDEQFWKQKLGEEYGTGFVNEIDQASWIIEKSWKSRFPDTTNNEKEKFIGSEVGRGRGAGNNIIGKEYGREFPPLQYL